MKIAERLTKTIKEVPVGLMNSESVIKALEFTRKMENMGVLRRDQGEVVPITEGGLKQLKLYVLPSIPLK